MKLRIMVLIVDGNPKIVAHARRNLCYLTCLRHLIRPRAVSNQNFSSDNIYFPSCVRNLFWVNNLFNYHVKDIVLPQKNNPIFPIVHLQYVFILREILAPNPDQTIKTKKSTFRWLCSQEGGCINAVILNWITYHRAY